MKKKIISILLVVLSFGWILSMIYRDRDGFSQIIMNMQPQSLLGLFYATICVCVSVVLLVPLFSLIIYQNTQRTLPLRYLARLFFAGQIVSYLPGRLLGTAYLINETQKIIPALTMIRINMELILTIAMFNTIVAASILVYFQWGWLAGAGLFTAGLVFFIAYHRMNLFDMFLNILVKLFPQKLSDKIGKTRTHRPFEYQAIFKMIVIFVIYWGMYLLAWFFLRQVFPMIDNKLVFILAATYTISWFIGFISMITPGGLGVREVSFVVLSSNYLSNQHMSVLSLFLRLWLIIVDLILFATSVVVLKIFPCDVQEN